MQGIQKNLKTNFFGVADNQNKKPMIKAMHRASILAAYGLGSKINNWSSYEVVQEEEFFGLRTFGTDGTRKRYIFVFRDLQDNDGHKFLAGAYGMESVLQTSHLKYALKRFKAAEPQLKLVP